MEEKIFKRMGHTGAWNIAVGTVIIVIGLLAGVVSIVNGAKLLKDRNGIMF